MKILELRKDIRYIESNYEDGIDKAKEELEEWQREQQGAVNDYLRGIFKVGFEFTGVDDGPSGGDISYVVVSADSNKVTLKELEFGDKVTVKWEKLPKKFDWYYTE